MLWPRLSSHLCTFAKLNFDISSTYNVCLHKQTIFNKNPFGIILFFKDKIYSHWIMFFLPPQIADIWGNLDGVVGRAILAGPNDLIRPHKFWVSTQIVVTQKLPNYHRHTERLGRVAWETGIKTLVWNFPHFFFHFECLSISSRNL